MEFYFAKFVTWFVATAFVVGLLWYVSLQSVEVAFVFSCAAISIMIWHLVSAAFSENGDAK